MHRTIGTMSAVIPPCLATTVPTSIQVSAFLIPLTLILTRILVLRGGIGPPRALLLSRFSYHTCFYTSQLKISLYHSKEQLSDTIFVTAAFYISIRCSLCLWTLILCFDKLLWSGLQILTNYYSLNFQINPYA